jgi:hypothetical protein
MVPWIKNLGDQSPPVPMVVAPMYTVLQEEKKKLHLNYYSTYQQFVGLLPFPLCMKANKDCNLKKAKPIRKDAGKWAGGRNCFWRCK